MGFRPVWSAVNTTGKLAMPPAAVALLFLPLAGLQHQFIIEILSYFRGDEVDLAPRLISSPAARRRGLVADVVGVVFRKNIKIVDAGQQRNFLGFLM
jgi:hypothetical protein